MGMSPATPFGHHHFPTNGVQSYEMIVQQKPEWQINLAMRIWFTFGDLDGGCPRDHPIAPTEFPKSGNNLYTESLSRQVAALQWSMRVLDPASPSAMVRQEKASFIRPQRPSFKACINIVKRVLIQGELYFAFDTISSAQEAADDVALIRGGEWLIEFITLGDFSLVSLSRPECIDELEGQTFRPR
ncbi:hypothetical protein W97_05694 [Coniosporium apollinis CBS 100218]|uniref:Uncharacterized protein n=1 Tax=Coniosporium apollinis (strain CBS 100218) TaxID=1168221 RepID=R7YXB0_CONA1|nr:uncharacterized protein W97_05694 [Coniosporium apollinis CBS 100218]EON66301.1 hypothetical protein W97_05694 [Coniosporium apollinis CBS 100218]